MSSVRAQRRRVPQASRTAVSFSHSVPIRAWAGPFNFIVADDPPKRAQTSWHTRESIPNAGAKKFARPLRLKLRLVRQVLTTELACATRQLWWLFVKPLKGSPRSPNELPSLFNSRRLALVSNQVADLKQLRDLLEKTRIIFP